jgi:hypothetical protein
MLFLCCAVFCCVVCFLQQCGWVGVVVEWYCSGVCVSRSNDRLALLFGWVSLVLSLLLQSTGTVGLVSSAMGVYFEFVVVFHVVVLVFPVCYGFGVRTNAR